MTHERTHGLDDDRHGDDRKRRSTIVYAQLGVDAGHLLTASVLSAPAGLLIAKIMFPETEVSETRSTASAEVKRSTVNSIDALCRGAGEGVALAINVLGMLIAFVATVALANYIFSAAQRWGGVANPITIQNVLGYVPVAVRLHARGAGARLPARRTSARRTRRAE